MLTEKLCTALAALDAVAAKHRLQAIITLNGDGDPSITACADPTPGGRRQERRFKAEIRRRLFGRRRARR
jgi:hypothetical protein